MSELDIIQETPEPRTRASLANDLHKLGVKPGMILIIHSSLRSIGWVSGGPVAVIQAIMDVVTSSGTIVMPGHTSEYSDPAYWGNPPVPQGWWQIIRDTMPAFDPLLTPSSSMGRIAETFRTWPDTVRSNHPASSFIAWGQHAQTITANQPLSYALGPGSPLDHIDNLDGYVLLLGVGYDRCTSMHLAEYRVPGKEDISAGAPIIENGQRIWKEYKEIDLDSEIFPSIGADLEKQTEIVKIGNVGSAQCRLFRQRIAVAFAANWLTQKVSAHSPRAFSSDI